MDTQSKVTVKALSTIKHGAEDGTFTEYNAGDSMTLTIDQANQLLAIGVVVASDEVKGEVDQAIAHSEQVAASQQDTAPDTTQSSNTVATNSGTEVVNSTTTANPTPADISQTLNSVELQ